MKFGLLNNIKTKHIHLSLKLFINISKIIKSKIAVITKQETTLWYLNQFLVLHSISKICMFQHPNNHSSKETSILLQETIKFIHLIEDLLQQEDHHLKVQLRIKNILLMTIWFQLFQQTLLLTTKTLKIWTIFNSVHPLSNQPSY